MARAQHDRTGLPDAAIRPGMARLSLAGLRPETCAAAIFGGAAGITTTILAKAAPRLPG